MKVPARMSNRFAGLGLAVSSVLAVTGLIACAAFGANLPLLHAGLSGPLGGPFNPGSVPGLAMWYDPSDTTTVFTDTSCTTPATTGQSVACLKDKSGNGCNMTKPASQAAPLLTVVSGSVAKLNFNGSEALGSTCLSVLQNVPRAIAFIAAAEATATPTSVGPAFWASINATASGRLSIGYAQSGSTSWGARVRRLDADAGVNVAATTTTIAVQEMHFDIEYLVGTNNMNMLQNTNPGSATFTNQTATSGGNTSNTTSNGVDIGQTDDFTSAFTGDVYQILLYTPASTMSGATMAQIDTYVCAKAGFTC